MLFFSLSLHDITQTSTTLFVKIEKQRQDKQEAKSA